MKKAEAISRLSAVIEELKRLPDNVEIDFEIDGMDGGVQQFKGRLQDIADQFE